jgi:hypothetical protein
MLIISFLETPKLQLNIFVESTGSNYLRVIKQF